MKAPRRTGFDRGWSVAAWAWELEDGTLCYWAEPARSSLMRGRPPSPDAHPVRVRIVRTADYKALQKAAGRRP